jgi:hypothetical protein
MPTDWPAINAEAAAIPGGVPWVGGVRVRSILADGTVEIVVGTVVDEIGGLPVVWWPDLRETRAHQPSEHLLPCLDDAGTRGHLRAALGSPTILTDRRIDGVYRATVVVDVHYRYTPHHHGRGASIAEAEARALIAYARANGGWEVRP